METEAGGKRDKPLCFLSASSIFDFHVNGKAETNY